MCFKYFQDVLSSGIEGNDVLCLLHAGACVYEIQV